MKHFKIIFVWFVFFIVCKCNCNEAPVVRNALDVFNNWVSWQHCYSDYCFDYMPDRMNEFFNQKFNKRYLKYKSKLATAVPFLSDVTQGYIGPDGALAKPEFDEDFKQNFSLIYHLIENNMPRFVSYLKDHKFVSESAAQGATNPNVKITIDKYSSLMRLLFPSPYKNFERKLSFAFANRCFEYCFGSSTWQDFKSHIDTTQDHELICFLYSAIWNHLVGQGWKDWSEITLNSLSKNVKDKKRVVYVAGGADIYQLLKHGIYNIDVIDPFLPSQSRYYTTGDWDFLVKGKGKKNGVGDKIVFDFDGKKIEMVRSSYSRKGSFSAWLSTNKKKNVERSVTHWDVLDEKKNLLGDVTFYRRPCEQGDFFASTERFILMSLNELYFAFLPKAQKGWDIKPDRLSADLKIYVKQLRQPVDAEILKNIQEIEKSKINFIRLGSEPA